MSKVVGLPITFESLDKVCEGLRSGGLDFVNPDVASAAALWRWFPFFWKATELSPANRWRDATDEEQWFPMYWDITDRGYSSIDIPSRDPYLISGGLLAAHVCAVKELMKAAEAFDIDSGPLWACGTLCRELFQTQSEVLQPPFWAMAEVGECRFYTVRLLWPNSINGEKLLPDQRQVLIDGEAAFMRLVIKYEAHREDLSRDEQTTVRKILDKPDGPIVNGFRWNGQDHYELNGKAEKLVGYLSNAKEKTATFDELAGPVWGDHAKPITSNMVGKARTRANKFFLDNAIPFEVVTADGSVKLFRIK